MSGAGRRARGSRGDGRGGRPPARGAVGGARAGLVVTVLLVALAAASAALTRSAPWAETEPAPAMRLERRPFEVCVEASGRLRAARSATVGIPPVLNLWRFDLVSLVPEGTAVEAGEVVAKLDAQQLVKERLTREAEVATLERTIDKREKERAILELELVAEEEAARVGFEKAELAAGVAHGVVSRIEMEKARIDRDQAERELALVRDRVASARAAADAELAALRRKHDRSAGRLDELARGIAAMELVAPAGGIVLHATSWDGKKVREGETIWRGRAVVRIPDLTAMEAVVEIDERDARHVAPGQRVALTLEADPDTLHGGELVSLSPLARRQGKQPFKVFDAVVALREADPDVMKPGMRVDARIVTEEIPGVLAVPESAVEVEEGRPIVRVTDGRDVAPRPVVLGRRSGGRVVVEEGLVEGESVLLAPTGGTS